MRWWDGYGNYISTISWSIICLTTYHLMIKYLSHNLPSLIVVPIVVSIVDEFISDLEWDEMVSCETDHWCDGKKRDVFDQIIYHQPSHLIICLTIDHLISLSVSQSTISSHYLSHNLPSLTLKYNKKRANKLHKQTLKILTWSLNNFIIMWYYVMVR